MKKIYHLGTCSTNIKILKGLNLENVELKDIKKEAITEQEIEEMKKLAGSYEALFSRKAMKFRSLGLHEKQLQEEDYKKLILSEYTFLKRPVAIVNDQIFIGNAKANIEALTQSMNEQ